MIDFKCHCGQAFKVENDQAGGLIQCPACGRLNDIPTLSDLRNIDADGNYKLDELEIVDEPTRLREVTRAFTRSRVDGHGRDIDLRADIDDAMRAGIDEIPLSDDGPPAAPKYDPLTGELIEPIRVKPDAVQGATGDLPMATPVLSYTSASTFQESDASTWGLLRIGLEILRPLNLLVMLFLMAMQFFWVVAMVPVLGGIFFLVPLMLVPALVLIGYYGKVVEETGPGELDELPRPLGSVSLREDIWNPFVGVMGALVLSFWPLLLIPILQVRGALAGQLALLLTAAGAAVFPAMLLTLMTSGTVYNLRPDRVLGVIVKSGARYWGIVLLFVLSQVTNFLPISQTLGGLASALAPGEVNLASIRLMAAMLSWVLSLHFTLWACFALGLLYRRRHGAFPWIFQKHEYKNRTWRAPVARHRSARGKSMTARQRLDEIAAAQSGGGKPPA